MTFRVYLMFMASACALSWLSFVVVVHAIDPTTTGWMGFGLFYLSLALCVLSSATFTGTVIRVWIKKNELIHRHVIRSLRQGLILTGLFLCALFLLGHELLAWWVVILLLAIASLIEWIFISPNHSA